jgi:hypothetical protein
MVGFPPAFISEVSVIRSAHIDHLAILQSFDFSPFAIIKYTFNILYLLKIIVHRSKSGSFVAELIKNGQNIGLVQNAFIGAYIFETDIFHSFHYMSIVQQWSRDL